MMEEQVSNLQLAINQIFLWFVLMVKAVCGENRTHGLEGGKFREESTYPYLINFRSLKDFGSLVTPLLFETQIGIIIFRSSQFDVPVHCSRIRQNSGRRFRPNSGEFSYSFCGLLIFDVSRPAICEFLFDCTREQCKCQTYSNENRKFLYCLNRFLML